MTPYRSCDDIMYDVIAGHENAYVNNSSQNRARAVDEVSLRLSYHDASTDMQHNLPGSFIRSGHLFWPDGQIFKLNFWDQNAYVSMRVDARNTWCFVFYFFLSYFRSYLQRS